MRPSPRDGRPRPGFTFSKLQADYLGIPWQRTFTEALRLAPALIRLGAYWAECQPQPGQLDFTALDWLLDQTDAHGVPVLLTVGMKAPRWPEYFLPPWLEPRRAPSRPWRAAVSDDPRLRGATLAFVETVVRRYRDRESISYWQVENEPLEPAGPRRWRVGLDFLASEIALVRRLDGRRPIVVNQFVRTDPLALLPPWRQQAREAAASTLQSADILGLDVYPAIGARVLGRDLRLQWRRWRWEVLLRDLQRVAAARHAPAWIIEAQAEPWEPGRVVYTEAAASRSVTPSTALATYQRLVRAGFATVLLWGVEHWYARRELHGDSAWLLAMGPLFARARPPG